MWYRGRVDARECTHALLIAGIFVCFFSPHLPPFDLVKFSFLFFFAFPMPKPYTLKHLQNVALQSSSYQHCAK